MIACSAKKFVSLDAGVKNIVIQESSDNTISWLIQNPIA